MKVDDEVLTVLSRCTFAGNTLRLPEKLDRALYLQVAKVIEACGGKWNRKLQAHLFPDDAEAHVETILNTGEVTTARDIGFFPTPVKLAEYLVELAFVKPGDVVLEPSAGTGRLVDAALAVGARVICVERDPKMRDALAKRLCPVLDGPRKNAAIFLRGGSHPFDELMDFLDVEHDRLLMASRLKPYPDIDGDKTPDRGGFDAVVMNPPFNKVGKGDHLDHVRHAYTMLRPGGNLAAILPSSITFRVDRRYSEFFSWVEGHGGRVLKLAEGSFKESGTSVNTCILQLRG